MGALFSWIGHADLIGMANTLKDSEITSQVKALIGQRSVESFIRGPVKITCDQKSFDKIILLWNFADTKLIPVYEKYMEQNIIVETIAIKSPIDYSEIYKAVDSVLKKYSADEAYYLLSPGTPAMAAVWLLLGKTKYPGKFLQTFKDKLEPVEIPFDLTVDVIPELLKGSEQAFRSLALESPQDVEGFESIIGESIAIKRAVSRAQRAAIRDVTILVTGESGSGKEMFARAIYAASRRKHQKFEAINCAALPANLLEAELFGYKKGAFTGANKDKDGAFKRLDGGTLFLDEIGECSLDLQAKLLRVLQPPSNLGMCCREFFPIGAEIMEQSDVRIIAATNRNLLEMVAKGEFRADLYYRLASITLRLPALRERKSDIIMLADSILTRINDDFSKADKEYKNKYFSETTKNIIKNHQWVGNVRELFNVILQGTVMSTTEEITSDDVLDAMQNSLEQQTAPCQSILPELSDDFELDSVMDAVLKHYIQMAMKEAGNVKTKAAALLGMSNYQRLDAQLKRLKILTNNK